ncbi:hypothetical protein GCM10028825_35050 [Spirosoma agri]
MHSFKISDEYNQQFVFVTQTDDENWLPSYNFDIEICTKKVHIFSKRVWFDDKEHNSFCKSIGKSGCDENGVRSATIIF